ncbi:hypothetical protein JXA34_02680 [Patescibacteria group bacterium]|nr:hypothetical protein [Patescibacteria group bacterium]
MALGVVENYEKVDPVPTESDCIFFRTPGVPFKLPEKIMDTYRVSEHHMRSLGSEIIDGNVLWADEHGNRFTAVSLKGSVPEGKSPYLERDPDYGHLRTHYLYHVSDDSKLERLQKISESVRAAGLPTETMVVAKKLSKMNIDGEKLTIEELKKRLKEEYFGSDSEKQTLDFTEEEVDVYLERVQYYEIIRIVPFQERLRDTPQIIKDIDSSEAQRLMHNLSTYFMDNYRGVDFEPTPEGFYKYYTQDLPALMGNYLARFHGTGYFHKYPTTHNWTLTGELVDLEGAKPLQSKDFTLEDVHCDLSQTVMSIPELYTHAFQTFCVDNNILEETTAHEMARGIAVNSLNTFFKAYSEASGIPLKDLQEKYKELIEGELTSTSYTHKFIRY